MTLIGAVCSSDFLLPCETVIEIVEADEGSKTMRSAIGPRDLTTAGNCMFDALGAAIESFAVLVAQTSRMQTAEEIGASTEMVSSPGGSIVFFACLAKGDGAGIAATAASWPGPSWRTGCRRSSP